MIELSQYQHLQQKQIQTLAQHQIQSLEILQLPLQDLQARIHAELAENPVLEVGEPVAAGEDGDGDGAPAEAESRDHDAEGDSGSESSDFGETLLGDPMEEGGAPGAIDDTAAQAAEQDEFLANLMQIEEGWRDYLPPDHSRRVASSDDDERRRFFFDSLTTQETLSDVLFEQLRTSDSDAEQQRLGEAVIGSIDSAGYLRSTVAELATACGATEAAVEAALKLIQSFEPPGIGARNLRECLMLQLERKGRKKSLAYAVVSKYIDKLAKNRIPEIARGLRVSKAALHETLIEVRALQPRPGNVIAGEPDHYVLPEVFVEKSEDGDYKVSTNRDSVPRLRVSALYRRLLQSQDTCEETRRYIREKINSVKMLMRSLAQRKSTIQRIAEIIVEEQRDFLERGAEGMRPLTMSQVAERLGVHETTVSRALAGKYVQTPRGLYPLKHFFTTGYTTENGDQVSSLGIKSKLQALVSEEDSRRPLSDQRLMQMLKAEGLDVARRTVAKYREELGIPSSHMRRSHGV